MLRYVESAKDEFVRAQCSRRRKGGKRISRAAFEDAMNRLFAANKIHVEDYGPPSKGWSRLAAGPAPRNV
jgi:hypothetical protein